MKFGVNDNRCDDDTEASTECGPLSVFKLDERMVKNQQVVEK